MIASPSEETVTIFAGDITDTVESDETVEQEPVFEKQIGLGQFDIRIETQHPAPTRRWRYHGSEDLPALSMQPTASLTVIGPGDDIDFDEHRHVTVKYSRRDERLVFSGRPVVTKSTWDMTGDAAQRTKRVRVESTGYAISEEQSNESIQPNTTTVSTSSDATLRRDDLGSTVPIDIDANDIIDQLKEDGVIEDDETEDSVEDDGSGVIDATDAPRCPGCNAREWIDPDANYVDVECGSCGFQPMGDLRDDIPAAAIDHNDE